MTPEELQSLMLLYVVDEVDAAERREVEAWLASGDPDAAAALADARATLAALPLSLPPVKPSDSAWARLETSLRSEPAPQAAEQSAGGPQRFLVPLAAAAAAAIVATVLTWSLVPRGGSQQTQRLANLQQQIITQQRDIQNLTTRLEATTRTIELLRAPALQTAQLKGNEAMPEAVARAWWDPREGRLFFTGDRLDELSDDQTYELWFVTDPQGPRSLGVFRVDENGNAEFDTAIPEIAGNIQAVAVSREPAGGATDGPTEVLMVGAIQ